MPTREEIRRNAALATLTGAGATAGGLAGLQALKFLPAEVKEKILAKLIKDRPLIISGILAPELAGGSGEAQMGLQIARKLRAQGLDARFGVSGGGELQLYKPNMPYDTPAYRDSFFHRAEPWYSPTHVFTGTSINHKNLAALNKITMPAAAGGGGAGDALLTRMLNVSGPAGKQWLEKTPIEKQKEVFRLLLSGKQKELGIENFDKALQELRSGKWNKFAPGRLMSLLKLDNSLAPILQDGADMYMLPGEIRSRVTSGRAAGLLSTERGFTEWQSPSLWEKPKASGAAEFLLHRMPDGPLKDRALIALVAKSNGISENAAETILNTLKKHKIDLGFSAGINPNLEAAMKQLLSPHVGPNKGVYNLGLLYGFKANPLAGEAYIPEIKIPEPPKTLEELKQRRLEGRKAMFTEINNLRAQNGLPPLSGKEKVFFTSGGSIGPNGTQKLIDSLRATAKDGTHIFAQTGGTQEFLDMVQENNAYKKRIEGLSPADIEAYKAKTRKASGMIADLEDEYRKLSRAYKGRFTLTSRMPRDLLDKVTLGADGYGFYGGSSTAAEATAVPNKLVATIDDQLNIGNIEAALARLKGAGTVPYRMNNASTAILRHLRKDKQLYRHALAHMDEALPTAFMDKLTSSYRIGLPDPYKTGKPLTLRNLIADAKQARIDNRKALQAVLSNSGNLDDVLKTELARAQLVAREQTRFNGVFREMARRVLENGEDVITRTDKGLRFGSGIHGIKNGLKGAYLRLGRALSKGPVGSRLAPLALGAGLLGGGAGSYFLGKKLLKD